ncbi:MAG: hypothetical protein AVDCRST_MAG89-1070, partial [uncultured Gemmatimonadetes bacterium]
GGGGSAARRPLPALRPRPVLPTAGGGHPPLPWPARAVHERPLL